MSIHHRESVEVVSTNYGPVEVQRIEGSLPPVLFMPGGHCTASTPAGQAIYVERGHEVLSFSRPGYGATDVGLLGGAEFVPVIEEVCQQLGIGRAAAVVGVSFGGMQAIHLAAASTIPEALVLHSCAPSTFPFPDSRRDRLAAPLLFGHAGDLTWAMVGRLVRSDRFLRTMMTQLSNLAPEQWFDGWEVDERDAARATFTSMRSGRGFLNDIRQAGPALSRYREQAQTSVGLPTLITASRADGGVDFIHSEDLARTIPGSVLVETSAPSHFFWIGPHRTEVALAIDEFLTRSLP
ncbi:MAG: alpha/beta hydrolase [Acidimicrobiia bacterium]|nr:alpha/beta hydrolase [Acidimicrobiia bacterium]